MSCSLWVIEGAAPTQLAEPMALTPNHAPAEQSGHRHRDVPGEAKQASIEYFFNASSDQQTGSNGRATPIDGNRVRMRDRLLPWVFVPALLLVIGGESRCPGARRGPREPGVPPP